MALAATLPPRLADQLPWRWQPEWRAATRAGTASHQVVADTVDAVRAGDPPPAGVPDAVVTTLRRGSTVEVAPPRALQRPDEVPVLVGFDEPIRSGDHLIHTMAVRFLLVSEGAGWRIESADGPHPAEGERRVEASAGSPGPTG